MPAGPVEAAGGLVVEKVRGGLVPEEKEPFQVGDVLLAWRREPVSVGELAVPIDWVAVDYEELDRGGVRVRIERGGRRFEVDVPHRAGGLQLRPRLAEDDLATYESGRHALAEGRFDEALAAWTGLADDFLRRGRSDLAGWLLGETVPVYLRLGDRAAAFAAADGAVLRVEERRRCYLRAVLALKVRDDPEARDRELAFAWTREAIALREETAAQSLTVARMILSTRGAVQDLAELARYVERAAEIVASQVPNSLLMAQAENALGVVALKRTEPRAAYQHLLASHTLYRRFDAMGDSVAMNLGIAARQLGDLAAAEDHYFEALRLREKVFGRDSGHVGLVLLNLGSLAWDRGDLGGTTAYLERAVRILEARGPETEFLANALLNLGEVTGERGRLDDAERLAGRALEIYQALAPASLSVAATRRQLGRLARARGRLEEAGRHLGRALELALEKAPESLHLALALDEIAELRLAEGRLDAAEEALRGGLAVRRRLSRESGYQARAEHGLGRVALRRGDGAAALGHFLRALDTLEGVHLRLGGTDRTRSGFAGRYLGYYQDAIALLVEHGRAAEAFQVLERSRARSFLTQLAERDLALGEVPAELREEQSALRAEYDLVLAAAEEPGLSGETRDELVRRRGELEQRRDQLRARIRRVAPRLASLERPRPLDLESARGHLDPGTLVLAYAVGPERSFLFLFGAGVDELKVEVLEAGEASLRHDIERLRVLVEQTYESPVSESLESVTAGLTETLLDPAAEAMARAERLLVLTDGPLHTLPFAALFDPTVAERRYLVEALPLHFAASMTVFAELRERRRPRESVEVAAFGDPVYPNADHDPALASPVLRSLERGGFDFPVLPSSRAEVEYLETLFADRARIFVGARATEEQAKQLGSSASILHFACHAVLDERWPLSSALALSIPAAWQPGRENGLLQAWEVLEQVRLDADLVTLSACRTGLGRIARGEGLLGLTRAFQFAGARSVLASLWSVSDRSTAVLMRLFYSHLEAGVAKDEALRRGQVAMATGQAPGLAQGEAGHPFYWAAFQLTGDWY